MSSFCFLLLFLAKNVCFAFLGPKKVQNTRSLQQPSISGRNKSRKEKVEPLFRRTCDLHFSALKSCKTRVLQQPSVAGKNRRRKEKEDKVEPLFQRTCILHFLGAQKVQNTRSLKQPSIAGSNMRRKEREDNVEPLFQRTRDLHFSGPEKCKTHVLWEEVRNRRSKQKGLVVDTFWELVPSGASSCQGHAWHQSALPCPLSLGTKPGSPNEPRNKSTHQDLGP